MIETAAISLRPNEQQTSHLNTLGEQTQSVRQNDKARETRPVENAENDSKPKMNLQSETRTGITIVDNEVVVEKYNSDGKLINVTPPGHVPLNRMI
jgi:hypothetical protein